MSGEEKSYLLDLIEFLESNHTSSGAGAGSDKFTQAIKKIKEIIKTKRFPRLERISQQLLDMDKEIFKEGNSLFKLGNPLAQLQIYTILAFLSESDELSEVCKTEIKILTDLFEEKITEINKTLNP